MLISSGYFHIVLLTSKRHTAHEFTTLADMVHQFTTLLYYPIQTLAISFYTGVYRPRIDLHYKKDLF